MAQLDFSIPYSGYQPNFVNALATGAQAAAQRNELSRMNALANVYQTQGAGILAGDQQALNALAGLGEVDQAMGVMDTRQGMDARALQMDATRQDMQMQAEQWAAQLDAQQAQEAREGIGRAILMMESATTPEAWDAMAQQLGKPELVGQFALREQRLSEALPFAEALARRDQMRQPSENTFIVSGPNDYGLNPAGQYNVTVGPNGVQADPIGSIPGPASLSGDEQAIALLQEIPNPQTGRNFTREEAIAVTQLYQISRDPVTGEVVVVNRASGSPVNAAPAQPAAVPQPAPPPPVSPPPPDPSFNMSDDAARAAFGLRGFGANVANTVTDTLGMGQMFPQVSQAQTDFSVAAESILADMARAWDRQPPSWVLQAQNNLIPRPGSIFTGPDTAAEQLGAIRRNAEAELRGVTDRLAGEISPTVRAQLEAQQAALANGIAKLDALTQRLQPSTAPAQGQTGTGVTWRIIE